MSTVRRAAASSLVYSSLAAYGSRRGGALPGTWFVAALAPFGHSPASVRQTLFRMLRQRELEAETRGRIKLFSLSAYGRAAVEAGSEKLFAEPEDAWDGTWTLVQYQFSERDRIERDRVRDVLETEGFAALSRGLYIHPRDRTARIAAAIEAEGSAPGVMLFRAGRIGGESDRPLVERLWHLQQLDRRYEAFLARFGPLARQAVEAWEPARIFATRFAVALSYLEIAWDDPDLPLALLPRDWRGARARRLARDLYERLLPGTLAHADAIHDRVGGVRPLRKKHEVRQ